MLNVKTTQPTPLFLINLNDLKHSSLSDRAPNVVALSVHHGHYHVCVLYHRHLTVALTQHASVVDVG